MAFVFADQQAFELLLLVPLIFFLSLWMNRRVRQVVASKISKKLLPNLTRTVSLSARKWKLILQCATLAFFILALARPQSGESQQKARSEGVEIVLAVDVSNSMMSEDVRPSRLELAKKELTRLLDQFTGDKVGLVAFAGSAILLSPLTSDKSAIKMYLEGLSPSSVATQGTDFKRALDEAYHALDRGGVESDSENRVTKVIVIASDGEDNEKGALDMAQKIAKEGVRIFTLGLGTAQGGTIPIRDERGNLLGYKKDKNRNDIISKSTGEALEALAKAGQGSFHQVTFGGDTVKLLKTEMDRLQKAQFDSLDFKQYTEHYQMFLLCGILLGLIEFLLGERRGEGRIWQGRFEVAKK
jgi:Ca-activated chloride channel family protein